MSKDAAPTFIVEYPGALSPAYCQAIIDRFENDPRRGPSTVGEDRAFSDLRTGTILHLDQQLTEWHDVVHTVYAAILKAMADYSRKYPPIGDLMAERAIGCRFPRIERIDPGQGFDWHFDSASYSTGHRVLASILYLNTIEEEGRTEFKWQGLSVRPEAGKLVLLPPYWTHFHRGAPPARETKYTLTNYWVYMSPEERNPPPARKGVLSRLFGRKQR